MGWKQLPVVKELERKVFNDNPSLKAHPKAQQKGYLSFLEFIKYNHVSNLKYHLDNYLTDRKVPFVNKSTPNYEQEFVKEFGNKAMHNNVQ